MGCLLNLFVFGVGLRDAVILRVLCTSLSFGLAGFAFVFELWVGFFLEFVVAPEMVFWVFWILCVDDCCLTLSFWCF